MCNLVCCSGKWENSWSLLDFFFRFTPRASLCRCRSVVKRKIRAEEVRDITDPQTKTSEKEKNTQQRRKQESAAIMLGARGPHKSMYVNETHFLSMQCDIVARRDLRVDAVFAINRPSEQAQVVLSIVAFAWREECAVEIVAIVKDGAAAAIPPREFNAGRLQLTHIRLSEWILMSSDHHAWIVDPQH